MPSPSSSLFENLQESHKMSENIYLNAFPQHISRSTAKDQPKKRGSNKRNGLFLVLSVLLFLSLLANVVLAYLYYTSNTNQLVGCEPVTNNSSHKQQVTNNSNLDVNKSALPCSYKGLPEKWIEDKSRFYVFSGGTNDWNSSRRRCQDLGGDLVIINSSEEQEFLAQQIMSFGALVLHWIGLTDHQTEGDWLWVDNTPLNNSLSYWHFPPDDHDAHDPIGEDCAVLNGFLNGEKWGDISCLKRERSICEIPCS